MELKSFNTIYHINRDSRVIRWFFVFLVVGVIILFLPWTQNVKVNGTVTTLYQDQRPQQLNSPIPGKIEKWFVKNGDFVQKGDTILKLAEVKDEYLDPNLIYRSKEQVDAKKGVRDYYRAKVGTAENQLNALQVAKDLKISQLKIKLRQLNMKLEAENAELTAVNNEIKMVEDQYLRQKKMYDEGLVSLTQFQQRNVSYQNVLAKKTGIENKLAQSRQEIEATVMEENAIIQDFTDKLSKIQGERFQSLGQIQGSIGEIAKLENQISNYQIRQGLYYVLASQDGQVVQLNKAGIGEILKETESIGTIVPQRVDYAVEMYVKPVDLPLLRVGQRVMCVFDGFPAIVFSGWPNTSYGIFKGKLISIENTISVNGLFKAVVVQDSSERTWPPQIRVGGGAQGIIILNDVPVWYELWRNINGFPPDYYVVNTESKKN